MAADGGTYWYVPAENLLAYQWSVNAPQSLTPIDDQTVWHIQTYDDGYFFGPVVAQLVGHPRVCQYATGSVAPDGRVYLSFAPVRANTHWAFMLQCQLDEPRWRDLPGTGQSVPDMLASCGDS